MTLATIQLNGMPVEQYGLTPFNLTDWLSGPKRAYQFVSVPLKPGQQAVSANSNTDARVVGCDFLLNATSFSDRRAKLNAVVQACTGLVEIVSVEDATKVLSGYLIEWPVKPVPKEAAFHTPQVYVTLSFYCPDPTWYDLVPQSVAIGAVNTPVAVPVGGRLSRKAQLYIMGPVASSVVVTLTNAAGTTLQTMTLTGTLSSAEYLVVDCDAYTVTKYSGGVATSAQSWLGLSDDFLHLDAADGPMLALSAGTGVLYVTRAWEA